MPVKKRKPRRRSPRKRSPVIPKQGQGKTEKVERDQRDTFEKVKESFDIGVEIADQVWNILSVFRK